ncbi:Metallo-dependent phosphatase, partial [Hyaloscypha variabilis F]
TKILILSDTHGYASLPSRLPSSLNLDLAIHCGDLSQHGSLSDYRRTLTLVSSLPAPLKLVIPGNHDLSLDPSFPVSNQNFTLTERQELHTQAHSLWTGAETKAAGIVLLKPGFHEFVLGNGARLRVYAMPYTPYPAGVDASEWAFGYASSRDMYNPAGAGIWYSVEGGREEMLIADERRGEVDVLVSHGPPRYRLDLTERGENVGCRQLWRAARRCKPRVHAFGHVHAGYGAERVVWKE